VHAESDELYTIASLTVARFADRQPNRLARRPFGASRTLLPTMSVPIPFPDPARPDEAVPSWRFRDGVRAVAAALAVAVGTAALGVLAGLGWAAVAPRPLLVMTSPGAAALVNTETNAFIAADAAFCLVCLAGGVVSGVLGYLFAVRRRGPLAMAGLIVGALAAAYVARWVGEHSGLATFQHLLATLPAGARLNDSLTLGATGALAAWPLAAAVVAGALELLVSPGRHRKRSASPPEARPPWDPPVA
jgi:hypothetical protein